MNEFLLLPVFGKLYFHHIYAFYDEPLVFSCVSNAQQYFFVIAIPSLENSERWLIVPISTGRLLNAERNKIEVRNLLLDPETTVLMISQNKSDVSAEVVNPDALGDDVLPTKGVFLDYNGSSELTASEIPTANQAVTEMRDVIEISLEKDDGHVQELPCLTISDTLENLQQLIYALAYKDGSIRGAIPKYIKEKCNLSVTGMYAASVGIRMKSDELCNIFMETPLTETLKDLTNLFDSSDDQQTLKRFLSSQNPKVASRYKTFILSLLRGNVGINFNCASPDKTSYSKHYSTFQLRKNLARISSEINEYSEEETIFGRLVGVNTKKSTFELITVEDEYIKGTMMCQKKDYSVPRQIEARVEMRIGQDDITGTEKIIYKILDYNEIVPT